MLHQEAFRTDEFISLHGNDGHRSVFIAQIGAGQLIVLGNGVLVIVHIVGGILRAFAQSLERLLVLVLVTRGIIILCHRDSFRHLWCLCAIEYMTFTPHRIHDSKYS